MKIIISFFAAHLLFSCGTNTFEQVETTKDVAEEATRALDEQKSDKAISILTEALVDDPTNYQYISLLASAKAQKSGVDTMDFALSMASGNSDSGNAITGLFGVVPDATDEAISLLSEAVTHMDSIPSAELIPADQFKSSMFYSSLMTMQTKALDSDGDGVLSAEELLAMSEAEASTIINSITGAESAIANYSASDGTGTAATNVGQIKSDIDGQAGSTDAEKLRNYLGS